MPTATKRKTSIVSGNFATGEKSKGNFSGYNSDGERVFINKQQLSNIGWTKQEDVVFPFYAIIDEKQIQTRDAQGQLTDTMATRLQALSIYKTSQDLVSASNADAKLEIASKIDLMQTASASGLPQETINSLLAFA